MMKSQKIIRRLAETVSTWMERNTLHDVGSDLNQVANAGRGYQHAPDMPPIVTLCGSTQFKQEFEAVQRLETQNGRIVLSVGMYTHSDGWAVTDGMKVELDELHKRKIDLSDEIIVINVGGYVGESTRSEIEYAIANAVTVRWLHVDKVPAPWGGYICPHQTAYLAKFSRAAFAGAVAEPVLCKGTNCTKVAGSDMPHSPECLAEYEATIGGTTGQQDLPPIVPEMIPSPNAQAEPPEPDMEALDAMERAGRLNLVGETRKAWEKRAEVILDGGPVSVDRLMTATSGWVQIVKTMSKELLDESGVAFNNRYHKVAAEVSRAAWDKAYCHLATSRASCSAKEIEDLAKLYAAEDPALDSSYDARNWT